MPALDHDNEESSETHTPSGDRRADRGGRRPARSLQRIADERHRHDSLVVIHDDDRQLERRMRRHGEGAGQTFLRGLQTADGSGLVTFNTIYPGWYAGRATHIHVEVFVNGRNVKTTQIAFPESVNAAVYASGVYAAKGQNPQTNASDGIFADGTSTELAAMSGSAAAGYTATLRISVGL
jgi:hypothetical protein